MGMRRANCRALRQIREAYFIGCFVRYSAARFPLKQLDDRARARQAGISFRPSNAVDQAGFYDTLV